MSYDSGNTATETALETLSADPIMLNSLISGVDSCLTMCDTKASCVGISTIPTRESGKVTGVIGVHGNVSGFITVNMAEEVALAAVSGLLQEKIESLTPQIVDGVGEMTNLISGGIKMGLSGTEWGFSHVTVPSVIIGQNYSIAYAGGLNFLCAMFEHENKDTILLDDRLIQVAISLIKI